MSKKVIIDILVCAHEHFILGMHYILYQIGKQLREKTFIFIFNNNVNCNFVANLKLISIFRAVHYNVVMPRFNSFFYLKCNIIYKNKIMIGLLVLAWILISAHSYLIRIMIRIIRRMAHGHHQTKVANKIESREYKMSLYGFT